MKKYFDIYIVGLGGQGVLTIGDLLAQAGLCKGMEVNFYPTKGMSQRGGFVQGHLRFGRKDVGASLPPMGADLVVSMERSESLKGVRYIKKGCEFLLYDNTWYTTEVVTKKASYPELDTVCDEITKAGAKLYCLSSEHLPQVNGVPVRANMYILGALLSNTALKELFTLEDVIVATKATFAKGLESNLVALQAGYDTTLKAE
jgi:indolepyruvate ferredoxin oxidoreductase beta subunit